MFPKLSAPLFASAALDLTFGATLLTLISSSELHYDTLVDIATRICDRYIPQVEESLLAGV